ncbi:tetratricopeptide repeat protein [Adlercreutzia equolifaciens]|uniref:tetratricopeptide repeat protein n=1 Tax=Adlercreutzia equolifaciens TaxID=446660 RepID=UPI0023B096B8|nr:tetratricopeptide repeat protein [Adlercreutzia equolifaciens]MDE8703023.1 tetratricopeptide repeat protein [Adlercreutzia equolifaciens]
MNNELFDRANERYRLRDYRGALMAFTECLQDTQNPLAPGEMGLLYHQIGNCLVKLKNPTEAIQAYSQATADTAYGAMGTVECNLGMAYASLRDYENAIRYFEQAVQDEANPTPYKSYMGMGNALMKLGKSAEAGVAFREAALDESNPDPTKALLNLGVCFMALNRPADAVASYESAMQFDMQPSTRNKLQASLGQAYVACGQMEKAVHAFEEAIADKSYFLSDSASVDYQRAVGAVAQGTAESSQATQVLQLADMSGLDVAADGTSVYDEAMAYEGEASEPFYYDEPYEADPASFPGYVGAYENVDNDRFFNATDAELEQWSRGLAKQDRKRRNVGLKILLFFVIVIVLAAAAGVFAYTQGYGYPTQDEVTKQLFADPSAAKDTVLSSDLDEGKINAMLDPVVADSNVTIDGVNRSMSDSTVYATATTEGGGSVQYKISMVRDGIGWKISNVELYFPSQS